MASDVPRLLFVHAHPDDETINNGATMAHYAARGAQVRVVTCTLGEEGEVIGDRWAGLTAERADQLGGYRIGELTAALGALGAGEPIFLGGAGRWRDSGMAGTQPVSRHQTFTESGQAAIDELLGVFAELRPHVVVSYDPGGGYGHPDHIRAHEITTAAVAAGRQGGPWSVPKFYWTVMARGETAAAAAQLRAEDMLPHWFVPEVGGGLGFDESRITTRIDASDGLPAKIRALGAHATQVTVGPTGRACALSNDMAFPILGRECYILAAGTLGDQDPHGFETDLLAGLAV